MELNVLKNKLIYRSRAPLRLGLAGGGTDVSPFSETNGGLVLNATIDLYAHAILEPTDDDRVVFEASDLNSTIDVKSQPRLSDGGALRLHKGIYNRIVSQFNNGHPLSFKLTTYSDAPPGSGLGTSSTMVVSIIQVFCEWLGLSLGEYDIAQLAYQIEREDLGLAGGKQDQYAASFGGFNFIEFGPDINRVLVNPLRVKDPIKFELAASTVLFYTGQSRDSAKIIQDQINNSSTNSITSLNALESLKSDAVAMKEYLLRGDLKAYADVLHSSWISKKQLASSVTNDYLDNIYSSALSSGAVAGKISGAGGGGFFMFIVPPSKRMGLVSCLNNFQGQVIPFNFTDIGSHSWVTDSSLN